jgi:hypothetical protein
VGIVRSIGTDFKNPDGTYTCAPCDGGGRAPCRCDCGCPCIPDPDGICSCCREALEIEAFAFDAEDEAVVVQARRLLGLPPWIREVPATGGGDAAAVVRVESDGAED